MNRPKESKFGVHRNVGAGRFSEGADRHALGFALGLLLMSVVGFLCLVGLRVLLKRNNELARVASRSGYV